MIVLDTTVLVYAVGAEHPLREPNRRLIDAIATGRVDATTTAEVIQEFVFERNAHLGPFDTVLAAAALDVGAAALVSADGGFAEVTDLPHVMPDAFGVASLLG